MSEPTENTITPGVKKTTRRFAPVKRGASKSAAGLKREEAAAAAAAAAVVTTEPSSGESSVKQETPSSDHAKSIPLGTMRPEGTNSGRLQSVNEGQKTRGGTAKVTLSIIYIHILESQIVKP